jgi:hypothetical protein
MKDFSPNSNAVRPGISSDGARRRTTRTSKGRASGEEGAILMLALAYLVVIGLVVALLSTWVSNDLNNSSKFSSANSLTVAASGMTDLAIQYVRYTPLITNNQLTGSLNPTENASPLVACWGGTSITAIPAIDGFQVAVWCSTVWQPLVAQTRTVTFYACPISVLAAACQAGPTLLTATVTYDDYPPAPARSAPIQDLCTVFCGQGMTIDSWQWGSFTTGSVTGVAATMRFSNEPSDTTAGAPTQAAVTVLDSSNQPVAGDTVTLVQQSGPSAGTPPIPGISAPSSTLTAITNTSGVATFTNIVPELAGTYTITAVDGSATALSTNFVVGKLRSVISTSTAPTAATQGGTAYPVTATATGTGLVTIADTTPTVCKLTGNTVTFLASGTCTITFNDPGDANFSPALQVTQSFPVGGLTITQVGLALNTTTPSESATTNDALVVTLENSVGATVASPAGVTTTVVLSDVASGNFSATNGTTGAGTLTLSFAAGQSSKPAYFGGQTTGPDTISAVNGTTIWGTVSLTVIGGTPSQVVITPNPTTPTVGTLTNTTLNLQLEDSGGNFTSVPTGSSLTLTLSVPTGFLATTSGTTGTSSQSVNFAAGSSTATLYMGNQTAGSDIITVKNGTTTWSTSTVTFTAGAATQAVITLTPTNPAKFTSTNATVTVQLEDQYGNAVHTSGVALTLSNSGAGYFAAANGTSSFRSTATLAITTNTSGVATGYFGDDTAQPDTITATGTGISSTTPSFTV